MLVVEPGRRADRIVGDLPALLRAEDVLVFNDTRVIPAQLDGARGEARIGATLHKRAAPRRWWAFVRNAKRVRIGDRIDFGSGVAAIAEARDEAGAVLLRSEEHTSELPSLMRISYSVLFLKKKKRIKMYR